jgi:hypoxanthine phosphoribosyltransferase
LGHDISETHLVRMPETILFLTKDDIQKLVVGLAKRISLDYQNQDLVLVGVLKGSFIFLSDLSRLITLPHEIDFIGAASYGFQTTASDDIRLTKEIGIDILNKNVLIVEDIIDTGKTLVFLIDYLESLGPKTLKICTLLDKKERREVEISIDYIGQTVESGFLVGYGLDYAEKYRNLSDIHLLKTND